MGEVEKKRKRIREEEPKDRGFYLRMSKTDMDALEMASYESEESKSDIMRKAFKMYLSARRGRF